MPPSPRRRLATAGFALALAGGGITLVASAFRQAPVASGPTGDTASAVPVDPTVAAQVSVGGFPGGLAAGGGAVWVTQQECSGSVVRIDQASNQIAAEIPIETYPSNVAFGFGAVWVQGSVCDAGERDRVLRIDPETNEVAATIELPGHSADIAAGEGGIWVSVGFGTNAGEPWKGELVRIDPNTNAIDARVPIEGNPRDVVVGEGSVWVLTMVSRDSGSSSNMMIFRVDPDEHRVTGRILDAHGVGVGEGSVWVSAWIAEWETGLRKIDPSTLETIETIERDFRPFAGEHNTLGTFPVGEGGVWFWAFPDRSASSAQGHARIYRLTATELAEDASVAPEPHRDWIDAALDEESDTLWISHYRDLVTRIDLRR